MCRPGGSGYGARAGAGKTSRCGRIISLETLQLLHMKGNINKEWYREGGVGE